MLTESEVLDALKQVIDPDLHRDIVALGFVKEVRINEGSVYLKIELTTPACPVKELLKEQATTAVSQLEGVQEVEIEMTARVREKTGPKLEHLKDIKHIVAIASGKGGVGKSTVTVNLAVALSQSGARVAVMDADVYGPTVPLLMGSNGEMPRTQDSKIIPLEKFGIKMMSLGFLLEEGKAVMWRGPLVAGTVKQLLEDVAWGELDYLLVDLPPGTGDAPMSLAQLAPLTGVVIVSTPHNVASNIAGKSVSLFRHLKTPILGIAENMGPNWNPATEEWETTFSGAGGEHMANSLEIPYLGSIPFDPKISEAGDLGRPSIIAYPMRAQAEAFRSVAGRLAQEISIRSIMSSTEPELQPQGSA